MWLANIPVVLMYLWFAMRARRWFFFSAANPGLPLGGAFGVSKYDILQRIPQELVPAMLLVQPNTPFDEVMARVREAGIEFPLIAKPDMGERGYLVQKIDKPGELQSYLYEW